MKAISVRQPWAWAIFHGKGCENRSWYTSYRGYILIHASKTIEKAAYQILQDQFHLTPPAPDKIPRGGIIGKVDLYDCLKESDNPWHAPGQYGFMLRDQTELEFIPCPGKLSLFEVSPATLNQATNQNADDIGPLFMDLPKPLAPSAPRTRTHQNAPARTRAPKRPAPINIYISCVFCADQTMTNASGQHIPCPACGRKVGK